MSIKRMLVNVHDDETRIALTEDNTLQDLHVEQITRGRTDGNIYVARIVKVNPSFQAAFVDYGETKNGFLSISDLNPSFFSGSANGPRGRIQSVLKQGQTVIVQVLKEGVGAKGAAVTTDASLPGRYLVLSPYSDKGGVSRKIENMDQRDRLKAFLSGLSAEGMGVIIRTAGIDRTLTELKKDFTALRREWKGIEDKIKKDPRPRLIYQEPSMVVRVLRDYFTADVEEVWVDSAEVFQQALDYVKSNMPKFQKRVKLYIGDRSLFSAYQIEGQLEALDSHRVSLNSGGSIVIEATEAMVAIDVNSGRSNQESDIEDTALRTNLEAASEVGRQLRLRNMGGLVVIDFIDMMQKKNQAKVEKAVADALKSDKARTTLGNISQFGMMELSRQRIDMELSRGLRVQCPSCGGTGQVPTVNANANNVLRKIREMAARGNYDEIHGELPLEYANFLLNQKRDSVTDLELEFGIKVHITANPELPPGHAVRLSGHTAEPEDDEETDGRPVETMAAPTESRSVAPASRAAPTESMAEDAESDSDEHADGRKPRRRRRRRSTEEALASVVEDIDTTVDDGVNETVKIAASQDNNGADTAATPKPKMPRKSPPKAILAPHSLPTEFKLGSRRDRRIKGLGASTPPGEAIFQSAHLAGNDNEDVVFARIGKRSTPLARLAALAEPGSVIYDSGPGVSGNGDSAGQAIGPEKPAPAESRRGRRTRSHKPAASQVASQQPAGSEEGEKAEPAEKPSRNPRARRRKSPEA